jgi:hypothetical protein
VSAFSGLQGNNNFKGTINLNCMPILQLQSCVHLKAISIKGFQFNLKEIIENSDILLSTIYGGGNEGPKRWRLTVTPCEPPE